MSRQDRNIEELFRALFDQFTVNPTPGLWKKVQVKIAWKQFLSFGLDKFNVYYLVLMVGLAGVASHYLVSRSIEEEIRETEEISPSGPLVQPEPVIIHSIAADDQVTASTEAARSAPPAQPAGIAKGPSTPVTGTPNQPEKSTVTAVTGEQDSEEEQISESPEIRPSQPSEKSAVAEPEHIPPSIEFIASPQSGCSPLSVNFQNLSEKATGISWNFGDGGGSEEVNPAYIFDEPGAFVVTLTGLGNDGLEYSRQQTVMVYETPKALFEFDEDIEPASNRPIYFYNYSRGGNYYEWDFGDHQRSDLREPIHFYKEAGNFHVKLKVWTDHQCYDSLTIFNAFTTREQDMKVPNAFTPNLNGPTGGYYDVNDFSNTVFHPVTNSELIEYQLKVFNRKGVLLFESKDISIGWDGYYNEQLMKQDVYIWKIKGKFMNGKTFAESGDVILIKQN